MNRAALPLCLAFCLLAMNLCGCAMIGPLVGAAAPFAGVKLMFACIPERTGVDTPSGSRPVEQLQAGDTVIGFSGKPVRILEKQSYLEDPTTVFLHITFNDGAAVDLCGMHRVTGIRARGLKVGQRIDGRQVARIQSHCGETHSFDLLTEDAGYQIQGVRINSMVEEMQQAAVSGLRSVRR